MRLNKHRVGIFTFKKTRKYRIIFVYFFLLAQLFLTKANAQLNSDSCMTVNIKKQLFKGSNQVYKSNEKHERLFYVQNEFNDSIIFYINDTLFSNDFYKTNFSSGSTGKILKFKFTKAKNTSFKLTFRTKGSTTKTSISFKIKKSILRSYKLFFLYKLNCGFNLYYSNNIPYYE